MKNKYFYLSYCILITIVFTFFSCDKNRRGNGQQEKLEILINTEKGSVKINNKIINDFNLNEIKKRIGEPSRIEIDTMLSRYEEYDDEDSSSISAMFEVINYYYIYDELGIMFYTVNGKEITKKPRKLSLRFKNKRLFTNIFLPSFSPHESFDGILEINNETLDANEKMIPENVDYNTKEFQLFHLSFGPISIGTVIDKLYSVDVEPYILLYLDGEESQRISYVEVLVMEDK